MSGTSEIMIELRRSTNLLRWKIESHGGKDPRGRGEGLQKIGLDLTRKKIIREDIIGHHPLHLTREGKRRKRNIENPDPDPETVGIRRDIDF